jgi:hypothetical protein
MVVLKLLRVFAASGATPVLSHRMQMRDETGLGSTGMDMN